MSHALILQHLKGATSQDPVTLEQLVEKTGLLPDTINMILDQMSNVVPAVINKVKVIKNGQTKIVVWPTGAIQPPVWRDFRVAASKTPPPKRVETNPHHQPKEPAMDDTMKAAPARASAGDAKPPRSLQILRYIEHHPGCSTYEVQKALKITAPVCYLKPYIAAGYVVSTQNKIEGRRPSNSIRLAPGITADELYKIRRQLSAGTGKPQSAAPTHSAVDETNAKPTATLQPVDSTAKRSDRQAFIFTLPAAEAGNLQANIRLMQAALGASDYLSTDECLRVIVRLGNEEIDARLKNLAEMTRRAMEEAA